MFIHNKYNDYIDRFDLSTQVVKFIAKEIAKPLTYVINRSLDEEIVPKEMIVSKIIPIYKGKGGPCELENYITNFFQR